MLATGVPPLVALALFIGIWQAVWASAIYPEYQLPAPLAVWQEFVGTVADGSIWSITWTSVHRAVLGFLASVVIATPLGLLVARVRVVRAAIGPLLAGMQSLPSVAWVPAAVLWFGLTDATIYFVVLLGAIPSIANGLVAGHRPGAADPAPGRAGDGRRPARLGPADPAAGRAARLPGRGQAGLGVLLALADGRGDHRHLPAAGRRAWAPTSSRAATSTRSPA